MAKRTLGVDRLFSLGNFKNLRITEMIELDDSEMSDEELEAVRAMNILSVYSTFALHQTLLHNIANAGFDPAAIIEIVEDARKEIERLLIEEQVEEIEDESS